MTAHTSIDLAASQASAPRRPLKVALFGFGTVGASVARILADRTELGGRILLTHVFNRDVEWFGRIDNLTNIQRYERDNLQVTAGRTMTMGLRIGRQ